MLTGLLEGIRARPVFTPAGKPLFRKVALFGAGGRGRKLKSGLERGGCRVDCFFDNDRAKWGSVIDRVPVLPPAEARNYRGPVLLATLWCSDVYGQLLRLGVKDIYFDFLPRQQVDWPEEDFQPLLHELEEVCSFLADELSRLTYAAALKARLERDPAFLWPSTYPQYEHPLVKPRPGDIIINAGAFNGDTDRQFHAVCGHCQLHSFEPDPGLFAKLQQTALQLPPGTVTPVPLGLYSRTATLRLTADRLSEEDRDGSLPVQVTSIDHYCAAAGIAPTLIKMDIEGMEEQALFGAQDIIRRCRPRLMISIYHSKEDLARLPLLARNLAENYRFFVGHHASFFNETILYGAPAAEFNQTAKRLGCANTPLFKGGLGDV